MSSDSTALFNLVKPGQIFYFDGTPWLRLVDGIVSFDDVPKTERNLLPRQGVWLVDADFYHRDRCIARTFGTTYSIDSITLEFKYASYIQTVTLGIGDFFMDSSFKIFYMTEDLFKVDMENGRLLDIAWGMTDNLLPLDVEVFFEGDLLWETPNLLRE